MDRSGKYEGHVQLWFPSKLGFELWSKVCRQAPAGVDGSSTPWLCLTAKCRWCFFLAHRRHLYPLDAFGAFYQSELAHQTFFTVATVSVVFMVCIASRWVMKTQQSDKRILKISQARPSFTMELSELTSICRNIYQAFAVFVFSLANLALPWSTYCI